MRKTTIPKTNPKSMLDKWSVFATREGRVGISGVFLDIGSDQHNKQVCFYPVVIAQDRKSFRYEDSEFLLGLEYK